MDLYYQLELLFFTCNHKNFALQRELCFLESCSYRKYFYKKNYKYPLCVIIAQNAAVYSFEQELFLNNNGEIVALLAVYAK